MKYVRALIQECKPGAIDALTRTAEQTLVSRVRAIPGFISHEVVKVDDRLLLIISSFQTRDGAHAMERLGEEWRTQYGKDDIVSVRQYLGEVIMDARNEPRTIRGEARPSP